MRFKSYLQFINEGARWNSDRKGVLISLEDRPGDILSTRIGHSTKKSAGLGDDYVFQVFYGLESPLKKIDIEKGGFVTNYSDLMQRLKQGYFNMVADNEPETRMTINDIARKAQPDLNEYDQKLFFEFMVKTGKIDTKNLKYIVVAESKDAMTKIMAETLQKYTKAEIVELKKNSYRGDEILKMYRQMPPFSSPITSKGNFTAFQKRILADYMKFEEKNLELRRKRTSGEMDSFEKYLREIGKSESGAQFLQIVFNQMIQGEVQIKGDAVFNRIRSYLNTKYNFSKSFIDKAKECLEFNSTSKMLIIDDNLQHGNDFKEILGMCGYITDSLIVAGKTSLEAMKRTKEMESKFRTADNVAQKAKYEVLFKEAQILERSNPSNITGYVLYKRPSLRPSELGDFRDPYLFI